MIKFGKSSGPLLLHKQAFFDENDPKLAEFRRLAEIYVAQPRRKECKNCMHSLGEAAFVKLGVEYLFCKRCGHLNGAHEDTETFCAALYTEDEGRSYGSVYASETAASYNKRVEDIYLPKAQFLAEALKEQKEAPKNMAFADLGAGSGYFTAALLAAGIRKVRGFEVARSQVELANAMLMDEVIHHHNLEDTAAIASQVDAEVVSLIGVLEHLQGPREVLRALRENGSIRYLFLSLPLFSPCVFFEMAFPEVMPRQLVGGHTHLYTVSSIDYFSREFGLERVAEWWFGTDLVDLFRSIMVTLIKSPGLSGMVGEWERVFRPAIDDMQLVLDKQHISSEVHMLLKVIR